MNEEEENIIRLEYERRKRQEKQAEHSQTQPIVNLPPVTKYLALCLLGVFLVQYLGGGELDYWLVSHLGFVPAHITDPNLFDMWTLPSLVFHGFLHGGWLHFGMNIVMLCAFGAGAERMMSRRDFIMLYTFGLFAGVFAQFIASPYSLSPMIGASGAISALFGCVLIALQRRGALGRNVSLKPFILLWVVISVAIGFLGVPGTSGDMSVAWAAHLGGFFAGLYFGYKKG